MQIVRTDVSQATAQTGEPILRVLFCGEGGECVTVDMAVTDMENDEAAVERARAILVQTATFGVAENEYDAVSNGNFDEIAITEASDANAGVYIIEYRDGEGAQQAPPYTMPSFEAARQEALRRAVDLLIGLDTEAAHHAGWLVRLRDQNGGLLCTIDAQAAEAARQSGRCSDPRQPQPFARRLRQVGRGV